MFAVLRPRANKAWFAIGSLMLATLIVAVGYSWAVKTVTIVDTDKQIQVTTFATTVDDVLKERNLTLSSQDLVRPDPITTLKEGMIIKVSRAVPVTVDADGTTKQFRLADPTVERVLQVAGLTLGDLDQVKHNFDRVDVYEKKLEITRIQEKEFEQNIKLAYSVKRQPDNSLSKGKTKVVQKGSQGLVNEVYSITYTDGKETARELVSREIIKEPVPEIIAYGVKEQVLSLSSRELSGREMLNMEASAYTHTGNRTATGTKPAFGTIAVDPKVIPLGTKLYVEGYGNGTAQDTGGAIKGNKIDLFYETRSEAIKWGRRNVKVYILE